MSLFGVLSIEKAFLLLLQNQVTQNEAGGVVHHLLGCLEPIESFRYNVHHYRRDCCSIIDSLRAKGVTPIVAGGTHYYIEAVLWSDFLRSPSENPNQQKQHCQFCEEDIMAAESGYLHHSWPTELL